MKRLTEYDYIQAAKALNCDVAAIKAVAEVESLGSGFLSSGEPVILFEGHRFHKLTNGEFSTPENKDVSFRNWSRKYYKMNQHERLQKAAKLNRPAALMSASWGKFQIMGFNFKLCGFERLQDFINAMYKSEAAQLEAFINFLKSTGLDKKLRTKNWESFARGYNGKGYKKNRYDEKLKAAYLKYLN